MCLDNFLTSLIVLNVLFVWIINVFVLQINYMENSGRSIDAESNGKKIFHAFAFHNAFFPQNITLPPLLHLLENCSVVENYSIFLQQLSLTLLHGLLMKSAALGFLNTLTVLQWSGRRGTWTSCQRREDQADGLAHKQRKTSNTAS